MDFIEKCAQEIGFLVVGNWIEDVFNHFGRGAPLTDFDGFGLVHGPLDERFNLGRDGG
jgi:hypothetical protein